MTALELETLERYYDYLIPVEEITNIIPYETLQNYDWVNTHINEAIASEDELQLKAAIALYWLFEEKRQLEDLLNQLLITPNHRSHQQLTKHLQDQLRYPSAVPFIEKAIESGYDYLEYTCSEDRAITKWFSHALNDIGTPEAIALMKKYSNSANPEIKDEMRYRLLRGHHLEYIAHDPISLRLIPYDKLQKTLPSKGEHFVARRSGNLITVYAAFNPEIANYAIENQCFGGSAFSFNRMTWVKPGFMWMMYRSGWATKENQERVLAIQLEMDSVREILKEGVLSTYSGGLFGNEAKWKAQLEKSDVRIQWDPDHDKSGGKLTRKCIQIGIRGDMLKRFNDDMIVGIEDITAFVEAQRVHKSIGTCEYFFVPAEEVIEIGRGRR